MLYSTIHIGDRIEISLLRDKNNSAAKVHVSQVEEITSERELIIHMPISYGQLVKLNPREKYSFLFFTEQGMIQFDTAILRYSKENELNFIHIELTSEGEKVQRREFFRFTNLLPIKFALISSLIEDEDAEEEPLFDGIIKDLSGGGLRFVTNQDVPKDSQIKCMLMLNGSHMILIGKVLHCQYFPKSNYKYQCRVIFVGILPVEQEKIIQYIFNEQRKAAAVKKQ